MDSMTTVGPPVGIVADARSATARPIIAGIVRIAIRCLATLERSRQRRALAALNDYMLHDIGLTRDDFVRRTSHYQSRE